jgi:hypothetical protein
VGRPARFAASKKKAPVFSYSRPNPVLVGLELRYCTVASSNCLNCLCHISGLPDAHVSTVEPKDVR